ncbi:MAG: hypothetical protein ABIB11_03240, partial [Candidatus Omnitrophota bacterium]
MNKCRGCKEYRNCKFSFASWIFFIIGLIATLAIRVVTVLMRLNAYYAKIAWYIGVAGFFVFFIYKYNVSVSRARSIKDLKIRDKIESKAVLDQTDYDFLSTLLCSLTSNKEKINY